MECREWSEQLEAWLTAAWEQEGPSVPEALAGHAAECPRCRRRLQASLLLLRGASLREPAPAGLAGRVAARLQRAGAASGRRRGLRRVAWPLAAALAAAVLTFALTTRFGFPAAPSVTVRLTLEAPGARQVAVVGDWNGWDPQAQPLSDPDGDGVWEIELRLPPGQELQYQFLIDGKRWIPDPTVPLQVEDGFGGLNSVLQI